MNPEAGMTLGSRYTLTERIATGGMGDVWRATDSVLGREVAVKVMRASTAEDPTFAERFRDEARHSAGMSHQNIATVYDYGEDEGVAYLVMELVEGEPLSQMIARGPMNPDQVRGIVGQAALALAAAHAAGVVHRDVKPANILITPDGRVKLTDFGIARAVDGASHTRTGEVLGTPQYLSPEQALGKGATGASDLYALGIITQEMLTGRKPFDSGSAVATALAQVNDPPPPLPDGVPSDLRRIVDQSLAKDPADRPTSAAAVAAALGMSVTGLAQIPPATSVVHTGDTDPDGTQVMDAPTGTELLGAIGFFAWAYASNNRGGATAVTTTVTAPASSTSTSTSAPPTTITPSRTTTTTQSTTSTTPQVVINKADYVGKSFDEAKGILEGAGWKDNQIKQVTQAGKEAAGTVVDVKPTGKVDVGTPITLTVSDGNATAAPPIGSEGGNGSGD